jgi:Uma2 family endonuclease
MLTLDLLQPPAFNNVLNEIAAKYHTADTKMTEIEAVRMNFEGITTFDGDDLCELSAKYPLFNFETEGEHTLIIKPMPNHENNQGNLTSLLGELFFWNKTKNDNKGKLYDSGGSVKFGDGSVKMPDITYILRERLENQPKDKVILIVPDFVVEYVSTFDSVKEAKQKMDFYMQSGILLAWLIVPKEQQTYIYKQNNEVRTVNFNEELTGEDILPNFSIILADIFEN